MCTRIPHLIPIWILHTDRSPLIFQFKYLILFYVWQTYLFLPRKPCHLNSLTPWSTMHYALESASSLWSLSSLWSDCKTYLAIRTHFNMFSHRYMFSSCRMWCQTWHRQHPLDRTYPTLTKRGVSSRRRPWASSLCTSRPIYMYLNPHLHSDRHRSSRWSLLVFPWAL